MTATPNQRKDSAAYQRHKLNMAARMAAQSAAGRDIAHLMRPAKDPIRRAACAHDLRKFVETYCLELFADKEGVHWPWARYHLEVVAGIEGAVLRGELWAFALPRGGGKTALVKVGVLWAMLYGHTRWLCAIADTGPKAGAIMDDVKTIVETNAVLAEDFPEVIVPIEALERNARKQQGQTFNGKPTRIQWGSGEVVLADVPGCPAAGATITAGGLEAGFIRGQSRVSRGRIMRPDCVLLDDPQNDEASASDTQTGQRLRLLKGAVGKMGPPGRPLAGLLAGTVINEGDLVDQILKDPTWHGVRVPMLIRYPLHCHKTDRGIEHRDWWEQYASLLTANQSDEARALYAAHRCRPECEPLLDVDRPCGDCPRRSGCMDCGAVVSWIHRKYPADLSAVDHAMSMWITEPDMFAAEMQQAPLSRIDPGTKLTPAILLTRLSGLPRGHVPPDCVHLTAYVDVHDEILYWVVCAWEQNLTGQVIDYGTFPEQPSRWFQQNDPSITMSSMFKGAGKDGAIFAGLERLLAGDDRGAGGRWVGLLKREYPKHAAGIVSPMQIERLLVDRGYKPKIVQAIRRKVSSPVMQAALGLGLRVGNKPISLYVRKPGWRIGDNWFQPSVSGTNDYPHVRINTNHWKSYLHQAFATSPGDPGSLTIFGLPGRGDDHAMFAAHVAGSEYFIAASGEWRQLLKRPDNHWFDCCVGCMAAASMLGCRPASSEPRKQAAGQATERRRGRSFAEVCKQT
jgi:hypothetical protein